MSQNKKDKKKIIKPQPISGFPEYLPDVRMIEQQWLDHIRKTFERYGYVNIETPAVEALEVIAAKGEDVDKEIYVLERLQASEDDKKEARLALHFDQTVPLARYTAQHFNDLTFPFKRYQMQKVWRGERPQAGRFREFTQCDIDVINVDNLPLHFDAEMPAVIWEVLSSLPGMENENIQIRVSNRKILMGHLESLGVSDPKIIRDITNTVDKLYKMHRSSLIATLSNTLKSYQLGSGNIESILEYTSDYLDLCKKYSSGEKLSDALIHSSSIDTSYPVIKEGLEELCSVLDNLQHLPEGAVVADLSIVRGLDYYTGTVYETVFTDDPTYGSICSGGRYDDLAGSYINKHLPGVGISIGLSRLFDRLRQQGKLPQGRHSSADVLVILPNEDQRAEAMQTAAALRARGLNAETYHAPQKIGKQMAYAEKKGIPYVWFPPFDADSAHEVKNMQSGEQSPANPKEWVPDE